MKTHFREGLGQDEGHTEALSDDGGTCDEAGDGFLDENASATDAENGPLEGSPLTAAAHLNARAAKPILEAKLVKEAAYVFDIHGAAAELPRWIDADTQAVIMRRLAVLDGGIERMVRFPPHAISTQMKVVLRDRQLPHDDPECVAPVTLRASPILHGKPRFNNVKVTVQGANRAGRRTYFGKCIAFFRDAKCNHLVLLQWYQEVGGVIDPIVGLPRLKLAPSTEPSSYDVLPAASIVNGTLLVPLGTEYFALMSCRELDRHVKLNLD